MISSDFLMISFKNASLRALVSDLETFNDYFLSFTFDKTVPIVC
jgi:hypothetical protein